MRLDADRFWAWSLEHYRAPGVRNACLRLQDQHRGNVNLALLLIYLDRGGVSVSPDGLGMLIEALAPSASLIDTYRSMRRSLKDQLQPSGYRRLLNFELELERRQQQDLLRCMVARPRVAAPTDVSHGNLDRYCLTLGAGPLAPALRGLKA